MERILIIGGAGYVGSVLTQSLIDNGYNVTVLDLMIYGADTLKNHKNLKIIKGDIRDQNLLNQVITNIDTVIHLACISNDPSFELNPSLGKSINLDSFEPTVRICKKNSVSRFIYASSSSVYGIKEEQDVHEDMSLKPLTDYSRYKAECEKILLKYQSPSFITTILRPATVCGYSPRQRLDVIVNIFSNLAYHKREISIFGGDQLRPNIHIKDLVKAYLVLLKAPVNKINGEIFNAGCNNHSVEDLALIVKSAIGEDVKLSMESTDDKRSYHISSKKICEVLGFVPSYTIKNAAEDLKCAFISNLLKDPLNNENYYNIKKMQNIKLV